MSGKAKHSRFNQFLIKEFHCNSKQETFPTRIKRYESKFITDSEFPEMKECSKRLETLQQWPGKSVWDIEKTAQVGFFFTGSNINTLLHFTS